MLIPCFDNGGILGDSTLDSSRYLSVVRYYLINFLIKILVKKKGKIYIKIILESNITAIKLV